LLVVGYAMKYWCSFYLNVKKYYVSLHSYVRDVLKPCKVYGAKCDNRLLFALCFYWKYMEKYNTIVKQSCASVKKHIRRLKILGENTNQDLFVSEENTTSKNCDKCVKATWNENVQWKKTCYCMVGYLDMLLFVNVLQQ
jgi:hypothetical protein